MSNLRRVFSLVEVENGWLISDKTNGPGASSDIWIASDLAKLGNVLEVLCSPEKEDEKQTASS